MSAVVTFTGLSSASPPVALAGAPCIVPRLHITGPNLVTGMHLRGGSVGRDHSPCEDERRQTRYRSWVSQRSSTLLLFNRHRSRLNGSARKEDSARRRGGSHR